LFEIAKDPTQAKVSDVEAEKIDDQFHQLCLAYKEQSGFS
jgi:hypothetical protein